ncbi:hypothetical protein [Carboxylicivirga marina]|uniref:hypothetical protein n=1 Tax=Carboxylicivirga marina TaxID=2800988 RepID=UPI0025946E2C|nr:hypothetical protein [uncultured Carboxylicivirga sp.]
MYYPEYIAGIVFITGPILTWIFYIIKLRKVLKDLGYSFVDLFEENRSNEIKIRMKGLRLTSVGIVVLFLLLAILIAVINQQ